MACSARIGPKASTSATTRCSPTIAEEGGLARERAREVLAGDDFATEVRAEERRAQESGIHAVPTFVFGGRFAVSGAQPPEALARAVRQALEHGGP